MPPDKLARKGAIRAGGRSIGGIFQDRFTEARSLAQTNAARNNGFINALSKMLAHVRHYLCAEVGSTADHCHNDTTTLVPAFTPAIAHLLAEPNDFHRTPD